MMGKRAAHRFPWIYPFSLLFTLLFNFQPLPTAPPTTVAAPLPAAAGSGSILRCLRLSFYLCLPVKPPDVCFCFT